MYNYLLGIIFPSQRKEGQEFNIDKEDVESGISFASSPMPKRDTSSKKSGFFERLFGWDKDSTDIGDVIEDTVDLDVIEDENEMNGIDHSSKSTTAESLNSNEDHVDLSSSIKMDL